MSDNEWDELRLDHLILPDLDEGSETRLKAAGFYG